MMSKVLLINSRNTVTSSTRRKSKPSYNLLTLLKMEKYNFNLNLKHEFGRRKGTLAERVHSVLEDLEHSL